ncbi:polysaccharide pyruvyl transferase family protein [bacterium]|nr:polysaccharide pyruvyl transferase family protein [bacterium]
MKTILLSTSSLWNCGDDFIREGVCELLNCRPDVRILWWNRGYGITDTYANDLDINLPLVDYFIVAGTPQWAYKNERIYRYCLKKDIPLSLIGVGTRNVIIKSHYKLLQQVAKSGLCELALARDNHAFEALRELGFENVNTMLDPAFFMQPLNGRGELNILGWRKQLLSENDPSFPYRHPYRWLNQTGKTALKYHMLLKSKKMYDDNMTKLFSSMSEPKIVIVHDNREMQEAQKLFGIQRVFYSTDYREMFKKFSMAIRYVGSRIHGAIPSFVHGAAVDLIYMSSKASVIDTSMAILAKNTGEPSGLMKVKYLNKENINFSSINEQVPMNNEILTNVIKKEREKIRNILKTQPVLTDFLV